DRGCAMTESGSERNPVEVLADEFLARYRQGERPALTEYTDRHPELAAEIRDLFPALVVMEDVVPGGGDMTRTSDGGSAAPAGRPLTRLGDYRILREVGRGGMGIVYEAEQESLGRHVALKVLPAHALLDAKRLQRFQREARAAAKLHHTNIVPVFGVGEADGVHFYAMQFIQGLGLDQVLDELSKLRHATPVPAATQADTGSAGAVARSLLSGRFEPASGPSPPPQPSPARGEGEKLPSGPLPPCGGGSPSCSLPPGGGGSGGGVGEPRAIAEVPGGASPPPRPSPARGEGEKAAPSHSGCFRPDAVHLPGAGEPSSASTSGWEYWRSVAR